MKIGTTNVGSYVIHSVEHGRAHLRTGGDFVLTTTWRTWGIEICRHTDGWAKFGAAARFLGVRIGCYRVQVLFGELGGYVPAAWISRSNSWWCLVTKKSLWPDVVIDDSLDADEIA